MAAEKTRRKYNRYVVLIILCFLAGTVYLLPYLRWTYYDAMIEAFGFTNNQLASLGSIFGVIATITYPFGGPLCDKFSPRKLLSLAFLLNAIGGFWFATFPSFGACAVISVIWGIDSTLLLWDCVIRVTRTLGSSDEQGKFYGLLEGGRGMFNTIVSLSLVALFAYMGSNVLSLRQVILVLSVLAVVGMLLAWIFLSDEIPGADPNDKIKLKDIGEVLKNPAVWLISLVILTNYSIFTGGTYLTPYLTDIVGVTAAASAFIAVFRNYVLMMLGGPVGGFLGDRFSITKVIVVCFGIVIVAMLAFVFVPSTSGIVVPIVLMIVLYLGLFFTRGIYFGTVDQAGIPMRITGTAVGVISFIGFIPEIYMNSISGALLDAYPGSMGYHYLFMVMLGFAVVGLIVSIILQRYIQKKNGDKVADLDR